MTKTPARIKFGNRLRKLRTDRGFSQESLADAVGLHRTYIGAVERGEQNIAVDNISKLAKALKVPTSELFK